MPNMSYCRFQNTLPDLQDCYESMDSADLTDGEASARDAMLLLCAKIAADYAGEIEELQEARRKRAGYNLQLPKRQKGPGRCATT